MPQQCWWHNLIQTLSYTIVLIQSFSCSHMGNLDCFFFFFFFFALSIIINIRKLVSSTCILIGKIGRDKLQ